MTEMQQLGVPAQCWTGFLAVSKKFNYHHRCVARNNNKFNNDDNK